MVYAPGGLELRPLQTIWAADRRSRRVPVTTGIECTMRHTEQERLVASAKQCTQVFHDICYARGPFGTSFEFRLLTLLPSQPSLCRSSILFPPIRTYLYSAAVHTCAP